MVSIFDRMSGKRCAWGTRTTLRASIATNSSVDHRVFFPPPHVQLSVCNTHMDAREVVLEKLEIEDI